MITVDECPTCGAPAAPSARRCSHCKAEFFVKNLAYVGSLEKAAVQKYITFYKGLLRTNGDDGEAVLALGLCYLDLGLHDLAIKQIDKAIEEMPQQADVYYYSAISLFKGRKPRILSLSEVKKIESLLEAACQLDDGEAKYYYLRALVKYEYYLKNGMRVVGPGWEELLAEARARAPTGAELVKLIERVPVEASPVTAAIRAVAMQTRVI